MLRQSKKKRWRFPLSKHLAADNKTEQLVHVRRLGESLYLRSNQFRQDMQGDEENY